MICHTSSLDCGGRQPPLYQAFLCSVLHRHGHCSFFQCVTAEEEEDETAISEGEVARKLQEPGYFGALQLLCDEAGFLVDSKAHKMLSSLPKHGEEGLTHSDQGLIQAGSVIKALGVTDGASFEALMAALTVAEPEGMESQTMGELTLIHPADAVTHLREFVESENGAGTASHIGLAGALPPFPPPLPLVTVPSPSCPCNFAGCLALFLLTCDASHVQLLCSRFRVKYLPPRCPV